MFGWFKKIFGIRPVDIYDEVWVGETEKEEPAFHPDPKHFHVDRHPTKEPKVELPDFTNMSSLEIDIWARNNLDLKLDRRFKKEHMINTIQAHINKEK